MLIMNSPFVFLLSLFFLSLTTYSQPVHLEWANSSGSTGLEQSNGITGDENGNIYTVGVFNSSVDFDPGPGVFDLTSEGAYDVFIQKLDQDGNFLWAKAIGSTDTEYGKSISVDTAGNVYVCGYFKNTVNFNPDGLFELTSNGIWDSFVLKLDADGNFIWAKSFGGTDSDVGLFIQCDQLDNIYISGNFRETVDFDPEIGEHWEISNGESDAYILKLTAAGSFVWVYHFGNSTSVSAASIDVSADFNISVVGVFQDTLDFDPGPEINNRISNGGRDPYLLQINTEGEFVFVQSIGGELDDYANSVSTDTEGNLCIVGNFQGNADFDPGIGTDIMTSNGSIDAFVQKYTPLGTPLWVNTFGGIFIDDCSRVLTDDSGNIYYGGLYSDAVDFDASMAELTLSSVGGGDAYFCKLNASGNLLWAKSFGGENSDVMTNMYISPVNELFLTGTFADISDMNPALAIENLTSVGSTDCFRSKFVPCDSHTESILSASVCDGIWSPSGMYYWDSTAVYYDTISNFIGCDSLITAIVTVNKTYSTLDIEACENYTSPSDLYLWDSTGMYQDTILNMALCDSIITINLTIHSIYSDDTTTITSCEDSFYWEVADTSYSESGFYPVTYSSIHGCDSSVVLDLTINFIDTTLSILGDNFTANESSPDITYQWVTCPDMEIVPGATDQLFIATTPGDYAVILSDGTCTITSSCFTFLSIDNAKLDNVLSIYPNPNNGVFYISPIFEDAHIRIYSNDGNLIANSIPLSSGKGQFDLTHLAKGFYIIEIITENDSYFDSLIIK